MNADTPTSKAQPISNIRAHVAALAVMAALSIAMTYPLAFRAWDTITNYGDPLLNTWIIAWDVHKLSTDPLNLFNANIFHPYTNTLAYSENLIGIAVFAAPLIWLSGNPVLAYNVLVLFSFVASGFGAYLLAGRLTKSWYAGMIAGLIFAFSPFRMGQFSHIQLLTIQWLPLTFLALIELINNRILRYTALFALFLCLQCLSCVYYAFYTALAVGLYLLYRAFLAWIDHRPVDWLLLRRLAGALIMTMIVVGPTLIPYFSARAVVGEREPEQQAGAAIENYLTMPRESLLGRIAPFDAHGVPVEETYFPGVVVLGLLISPLVLRRLQGGDEDCRAKQSREVTFFLILGALSFILSLGPTLRLTVDGEPILAPLPYTFVYEWLPGFKAMRVPARLAIVAVFAWSILAAYTAARLACHRRIALQIIIVVALMIEYLSVPVPMRPIEVGDRVPSVYRWLASLPQKAVILELPSTTSPWFWEDTASMGRLARQQYLSTYHWHSSIMGYSGFYPPLFWESIDHVLTFPSTEALSYLRGMGVQYVIVHPDEMEPEQWAAFQRRLALFADKLTLLRVIEGDLVYALNEPVQNPRNPDLELYLPTVTASEFYEGYIRVRNPNQGAFVCPVPETYTLTYEWSGSDGAIVRGSIEGLFPLTISEGVDSIPVMIPCPPMPLMELRATLKGLGQVATADQRVTRMESALVDVPPPVSADEHILRADLNFGDQMRLSHVRLGADSCRAGDSLSVTLYWQRLEEEPGEDIIAFLKVLDPKSSETIAQINLPPASRRGPVSSWSVGETVIDRHLLQLPVDIAPGRYRVVAGLYDQRADRNLPVVSEDGTRQDSLFETAIAIK